MAGRGSPTIVGWQLVPAPGSPIPGRQYVSVRRGSMMGWGMHECALRGLGHFDELMDQQYTWINEVLAGAAKCLATDQVELLPKTPSELVMRQKVSRMRAQRIVQQRLLFPPDAPAQEPKQATDERKSATNGGSSGMDLPSRMDVDSVVEGEEMRSVRKNEGRGAKRRSALKRVSFEELRDDVRSKRKKCSESVLQVEQDNGSLMISYRCEKENMPSRVALSVSEFQPVGSSMPPHSKKAESESSVVHTRPPVLSEKVLQCLTVMEKSPSVNVANKSHVEHHTQDGTTTKASLSVPEDIQCFRHSNQEPSHVLTHSELHPVLSNSPEILQVSTRSVGGLSNGIQLNSARLIPHTSSAVSPGETGQAVQPCHTDRCSQRVSLYTDRTIVSHSALQGNRASATSAVEYKLSVGSVVSEASSLDVEVEASSETDGEGGVYGGEVRWEVSKGALYLRGRGVQGLHSDVDAQRHGQGVLASELFNGVVGMKAEMIVCEDDRRSNEHKAGDISGSTEENLSEMISAPDSDTEDVSTRSEAASTRHNAAYTGSKMAALSACHSQAELKVVLRKPENDRTSEISVSMSATSVVSELRSPSLKLVVEGLLEQNASEPDTLNRSPDVQVMNDEVVDIMSCVVVSDNNGAAGADVNTSQLGREHVLSDLSSVHDNSVSDNKLFISSDTSAADLSNRVSAVNQSKLSARFVNDESDTSYYAVRYVSDAPVNDYSRQSVTDPVPILQSSACSPRHSDQLNLGDDERYNNTSSVDARLCEGEVSGVEPFARDAYGGMAQKFVRSLTFDADMDLRDVGMSRGETLPVVTRIRAGQSSLESGIDISSPGPRGFNDSPLPGTLRSLKTVSNLTEAASNKPTFLSKATLQSQKTISNVFTLARGPVPYAKPTFTCLKSASNVSSAASPCKAVYCSKATLSLKDSAEASPARLRSPILNFSNSNKSTVECRPLTAAGALAAEPSRHESGYPASAASSSTGEVSHQGSSVYSNTSKLSHASHSVDDVSFQHSSARTSTVSPSRAPAAASAALAARLTPSRFPSLASDNESSSLAAAAAQRTGDQSQHMTDASGETSFVSTTASGLAVMEVEEEQSTAKDSLTGRKRRSSCLTCEGSAEAGEGGGSAVGRVGGSRRSSRAYAAALLRKSMSRRVSGPTRRYQQAQQGSVLGGPSLRLGAAAAAASRRCQYVKQQQHPRNNLPAAVERTQLKKDNPQTHTADNNFMRPLPPVANFRAILRPAPPPRPPLPLTRPPLAPPVLATKVARRRSSSRRLSVLSTASRASSSTRKVAPPLPPPRKPRGAEAPAGCVTRGLAAGCRPPPPPPSPLRRVPSAVGGQKKVERTPSTSSLPRRPQGVMTPQVEAPPGREGSRVAGGGGMDDVVSVAGAALTPGGSHTSARSRMQKLQRILTPKSKGGEGRKAKSGLPAPTPAGGDLDGLTPTEGEDDFTPTGVEQGSKPVLKRWKGEEGLSGTPTSSLRLSPKKLPSTLMQCFASPRRSSASSQRRRSGQKIKVKVQLSKLPKPLVDNNNCAGTNPRPPLPHPLPDVTRSSAMPPPLVPPSHPAPPIPAVPKRGLLQRLHDKVRPSSKRQQALKWLDGFHQPTEDLATINAQLELLRQATPSLAPCSPSRLPLILEGSPTPKAARSPAPPLRIQAMVDAQSALMEASTAAGKQTTCGAVKHTKSRGKQGTRNESPLNYSNYNIADIHSDDSTDDESKPKRVVPEWAQGSQLMSVLIDFHYHPIETTRLFGRIFPPDLNEMFDEKKPRFDKRTSSANWEHSVYSSALDLSRVFNVSYSTSHA